METEIKTLTIAEDIKVRRTASGVRINQDKDSIWLSEQEAIQLRNFLNQLNLGEEK